MQTIDIFKTNVQNNKQARMVTGLLKVNFTKAEINFDLEDCDRIMRVKRNDVFEPAAITRYIRKLGFRCEELN